jgi:hypothetical protein
MCRNIRPLFNFEPAATPDEVGLGGSAARRLDGSTARRLETIPKNPGSLRVEAWKVEERSDHPTNPTISNPSAIATGHGVRR